MTIATHGPRWGAGSLGSKSRWRPMTARQDKPLPHPLYRWKQTTRRELRAEAAKHDEERRALDRKWKKISDERLAEKNTRTRARVAKHQAKSVSRSFAW